MPADVCDHNIEICTESNARVRLGDKQRGNGEETKSVQQHSWKRHLMGAKKRFLPNLTSYIYVLISQFELTQTG
jgi:hypothetical protein